MNLDLTKVFEQQQKLDKEIHIKHGVSYKTIGEELKLALLVELSELANEIRSFKFWSIKGPSDKNIILEEYVDCIHFISSICIKYKIKPIFPINANLEKYQNKKEITKSFVSLFKKACNISIAYKAKKWYISFIEFGLKLGFTINEIIDAYNKKNLINHSRQSNNY